MTEDSILAKLRLELDRELTEECQVVYILAEIRKFLERTAHQANDYFALEFYCSLALHTTMSFAGARRILERFEQAYPLLIKNIDLPKDLDKEISDTISLKKFRDQLKSFFSAHELIPSRMFPGAPDPWVKFIHLYANAIDECDLKLEGAGLPLVDRVSFHLALPTRALGPEWANQVLFALRWTCHGKDGSSGDHEVYFGYSVKDVTA